MQKKVLDSGGVHMYLDLQHTNALYHYLSITIMLLLSFVSVLAELP